MICIFHFQNVLLIKEIINIVSSFSPCHLKCQKHVRIYATHAIFPQSETADMLKPVL